MMKEGDRVVHEYLGTGTFIKDIKGTVLSLVRWDKIPPARYNMGENPTCVFTKDLIILDGEDGE